MHHSYIDKQSYLDSWIHRRDARVKMLVFSALVLAIVVTPIKDLHKFLFYFLFLCAIIFLSGIDILYVLRRCLVVLPFALLIAAFLPFRKGGEVIWQREIGPLHPTITKDGLWLLLNVVIKSMLSALSLIVLVSTTRFATILRVLGNSTLVTILSFLYRYLFVLVDEAERMKRARNSRYFGGAGLRQMKAIAGIIGVLFMRTYDRAERIHAAMASRGFTGTVKTLDRFSIVPMDIMFGALCAVCIVAIFVS